MNREEKILEQLEKYQTRAPDGFAERVMDSLPEKRSKPSFREQILQFWPTHGRWIAPALVGAVASLLIVFGWGRMEGLSSQEIAKEGTTIHFELHAPGADRVELLGTFNDWKTGNLVLVGPDASGHWTAEVAIPEGRHEYIFLVDGERWVADPKASTHRPDGFGRVNTVIKVYEDDPA